MTRFRFAIALFALVLVAAACGGTDEPSSSDTAAGSTTDMEEDEDHDDGEEASEDHDEGEEASEDHDEGEEASEEHSEEYLFGEPREASDASRVIEIATNDDMTFTPARVVVTQGEIVTFRVSNPGLLPHDLTLGDSETQDEHEAEMVEMMAEMGEDLVTHDEPNAIVVASGETKEITWHMTETGEILFGCHQPGHYAAGMVGTLSVEA